MFTTETILVTPEVSNEAAEALTKLAELQQKALKEKTLEDAWAQSMNEHYPSVSNMVDHPNHYTPGTIECIDALRAALGPAEFAGFLRGNAIKYLWRATRKGAPTQDFDKAIWYINRLKMEFKNAN